MRRIAIWLATCMLLGVGILGAVVLPLAFAYGSIDLALARLRGEQFVLSPSAIELGDVGFGQRRECQLRVVNLSDESLELIGLSAGCGCTILQEELPMSVPARSSRLLALSIVMKSKQRDVTIPFAIYTGRLSNRSANGVITAKVQFEPNSGEL